MPPATLPANAFTPSRRALLVHSAGLVAATAAPAWLTPVLA